MGGPGSGQWYRWKGTRTTLEGVNRLDVRWLHRHGYLDGCPHWVTWSCGERRVGGVMLALQAEGMVLTYRYRVHGRDWESVRQVITLDWTPCHYGGERPWFRCAGCRRRVAVLCSAGKWFLCRHCYELPYGSQQETEEARLLRKVRTLRARLGASMNLLEPIWTKPTGMHWRTFDRLLQEVFSHRRLRVSQPDVEVTTSSPRTVLAELHARGYRRAWLVGGGQLAGAFRAQGLITEYIVTVIPIILGTGIPLFGAVGPTEPLQLVASQVYPNGLVQLHYRRAPEA